MNKKKRVGVHGHCLRSPSHSPSPYSSSALSLNARHGGGPAGSGLVTSASEMLSSREMKGIRILVYGVITLRRTCPNMQASLGENWLEI
eukprot:6176529-Pleurochrysis_carterae.AAC.10